MLKQAVKRLGGRAIDQRTTLGRALAQWRAELVADLGGPEAVSTQQQALIELAVRTKLLLDSIDAWLLAQPSLVNARRRTVLPVVLQRQQLADGLARSLTQLGLERRPRKTTDPGLASPAPASRALEQLAEQLLGLEGQDFIKALDALMPGKENERPLVLPEREDTTP